MGYGIGGHIGFGKETTWSTAVVATDYALAFSESLTEERDRFDVTNIAGRLSEPDDMAGVRRAEGDVVFPAHPESMGFFLNGIFGVQSTTEILSGFLHSTEFTFNTSDTTTSCPVPSYTFEINRGIGSSQQFAGCAVSALEMSLAPNQDLRMTASMIGVQGPSIAKTTPSFPGSSVDPFAFDTCSIALGGSAFAKMEALTVNVDIQLEGVPTLNNTTTIAKIRRTGAQMVRLSGTMEFDDIDQYEIFRAQTEQAMTVNLTRADSFSCLIDMPRVVFASHPVGMGDRGRILSNFEGIARYHVGSAQTIKVTLTTIQSNW